MGTTATTGTSGPATKTLTTSRTQPTGNCAHPSFSTRDSRGTDNTDSGEGAFWWVDNDAWNGSHGPQILDVCNQSSWYAVSNQPNNSGAVETYPNTEYDVGGRDHRSTTPISRWYSITSSFSEAFPSAGGWDAAYDLWLNDWHTEIMIWNQWTGAPSVWPSRANHSRQLGRSGVPLLRRRRRADVLPGQAGVGGLGRHPRCVPMACIAGFGEVFGHADAARIRGGGLLHERR